jgi:epoxyqueuosine reductase
LADSANSRESDIDPPQELPQGDSAAALTAERVNMLARSAGFAEAGVVAIPYADEARNALRFSEWIATGKAASMQYLSRAADTGELLRKRVTIPFPWARSIVVCLASYPSDHPRSTDQAEEGSGWIARYAWTGRRNEDGALRPSDYHRILLKRLHTLESDLHNQYGDFEARAFVDTGPVVERSLAIAAGLGWTGKNTTLIHPRLGSYTFLAVLVTALKAQSWLSLVPDRCGSCRRCLDACPTGALTDAYQMDARRCIAYLTIEHRGEITDHREEMGRQIFGCDICQDVCPWNRKAQVTADYELLPRTELINPALEWLARLDESSFDKLANGSPLRRAGFNGLRRNIAIAMGNSGLEKFLPLLEKWTAEINDGLRSAAGWAISRIRQKI